MAAKNFHLTLLRSFLLPSLLSLLLLLLRTLLTPCWPILKVQPKFRLRCLLARAHAHRMQINIQYTSCNDTHRAHSHTLTHTRTHADTVALQHVALQDKVLPVSLYVLGSHSVSWLFNCFLSLHFDFLLEWVAQLFAACCKLPPSGWEGRVECDRVVYFYYIVVRLPQLAEKVCNFILNSLPPSLFPCRLTLQLKCNTHIHRHTLRTCCHTSWLDQNYGNTQTGSHSSCP